jgi:glycosyltransferase involved in cell wall biosynthesis
MINKFLVVSGAALKLKDGQFYGYAPYIKELNIWLKHVNNVVIACPLDQTAPSQLDMLVAHNNIKTVFLPTFSTIGIKQVLKAAFWSPIIMARLFILMLSADIIHLRSPSNIGMLGAIVQIFLPWKRKIVKYAGNWDWNTPQAVSFRLQQVIYRSTFWSKNMTTLVYGAWPDRTKNILPFFTATYKQSDIEDSPVRSLSKKDPINLLFVGSLLAGKKPLISSEAVKILKENGLDVKLHYFGEGPERKNIEHFIEKHQLQNEIVLNGNRSPAEVKEAFKESHFLVFISRSEGWPKVVAESMFWGCYPITTRVSMVPEMLGDGLRGSLVDAAPKAVADAILDLVNRPDLYRDRCQSAMVWSREFTLERFEQEISKMLQ